MSHFLLCFMPFRCLMPLPSFHYAITPDGCFQDDALIFDMPAAAFRWRHAAVHDAADFLHFAATASADTLRHALIFTPRLFTLPKGVIIITLSKGFR